MDIPNNPPCTARQEFLILARASVAAAVTDSDATTPS
jgi:hypothetical protein